jgi:hypothetical protein
MSYTILVLAILRGRMKAKLNNLVYKYQNDVDALKKEPNMINQIKIDLLKRVIEDLRKLKE